MNKITTPNVHSGHRIRLKERFLEYGIDGFEQHNILELLLFYVIQRKDTNEIAHNLIMTFGSISGVLDAPIDEIVKIKPMTENAAILLKLIPQLSRIYLKDKANIVDITFDSSAKINEYFTNIFVGYTQEHLFMLCLDNSNKPIKCELVGKGVVNKLIVDMRKLIEVAIKCNANSVIIAHNHPEGKSDPSNNDIITTSSIKSTLKMINIHLIDHIIVGSASCFSFLDAGML